MVGNPRSVAACRNSTRPAVQREVVVNTARHGGGCSGGGAQHRRGGRPPRRSRRSASTTSPAATPRPPASSRAGLAAAAVPGRARPAGDGDRARRRRRGRARRPARPGGGRRTLTVLVGQTILGWHNDIVDRDRDARHRAAQADRRRPARPRHRLVRAHDRGADPGAAVDLDRRHRRHELPDLVIIGLLATSSFAGVLLVGAVGALLRALPRLHLVRRLGRRGGGTGPRGR